MSHDDDLAVLRERVANGELDASYDALVTLESALDDASDDGVTDRDLLRTYGEPFADGLDRLARVEGWPALAEVVEAYDPRTAAEFPHVTAVIANAVGRLVVRTRLEVGVEAIPAGALAYLDAIPFARTSGADAAFEEAGTYGWGIGHPDEPVADHLHDAAEDQAFWVSAAIEAALYADQAAAVDLLARIVTDDTIEVDVRHSLLDPDAPRFFLASVAGPATGRDRTPPRYWDWRAEYDYVFSWDPEVQERVRKLARETGVAEELPPEWEIADLAI